MTQSETAPSLFNFNVAQKAGYIRIVDGRLLDDVEVVVPFEEREARLVALLSQHISVVATLLDEGGAVMLGGHHVDLGGVPNGNISVFPQHGRHGLDIPLVEAQNIFGINRFQVRELPQIVNAAEEDQSPHHLAPLGCNHIWAHEYLGQQVGTSRVSGEGERRHFGHFGVVKDPVEEMGELGHQLLEGDLRAQVVVHDGHSVSTPHQGTHNRAGHAHVHLLPVAAVHEDEKRRLVGGLFAVEHIHQLTTFSVAQVVHSDALLLGQFPAIWNFTFKWGSAVGNTSSYAAWSPEQSAPARPNSVPADPETWSYDSWENSPGQGLCTSDCTFQIRDSKSLGLQTQIRKAK